MATATTPTRNRRKTVTPRTPDHEVLVVGAGFGGIAAGIALIKAGIENFVIVEKWHDVGGTWLANTYPGVAVDVPSFIYSFSFAQKGNWSRLFAPGEELRQYAEEVVDAHGLRPRLRLGTTVEACRFDETDDLWEVTTDQGTMTARFLIGAVGGLEVPHLPDIPGVETFAGKTIHTARWDHDFDLAGKRVAVIGTGASALQLIPAIVDEVDHLTVFQRTPIWVAPKPDFAAGPVTRFVLGNRLLRYPLRAAGMVGVEVGLGGALLGHRVVPPVVHGVEAALKLWMRTQVPDDELREKLTPTYMLGCKRPSVSNTYLKTFMREDVTLSTDPIARITETSVVTDDGTEHEIDVLICATGFKVMAKGATPPYPVVGRDGRELNDFWDRERYQAYQGVTVPGFPNSFLVIGPYAYSPGSYLVLIESTVAHAVRAITETRRRGATRCEVKQEPHDRYWAQMLDRAQRTPLMTPHCNGSNSYYLNYHGDAAAYRPSTGLEMRWQNRHFALNDYVFSARTPEVARSARIAG